ncbi:hypothetical protein ABZ434_26090 [Streptomyces sp. NPDC005761]|uniref:hypothetical protein n=1 Tax=Streptomyces sp. NPDC005761 TaxID=3157066 RepID=UPI0033E2858C
MTSGDKWRAVGPASVGFETKLSTFAVGARINGLESGLVAVCEDSGTGVKGTGKGEGRPGVHGFSGSHNGVGVKGEAHDGEGTIGVWGRSEDGYAGYFDGPVHVNGDLEVDGNKGVTVRMDDGTYRVLYAVEAPEHWFEDFGFGRLVDGRAQVTLDPGFVAVTEEGPYHVFLTEYEAASGLYVTDRNSRGFGVRAASGADARSEFGYRVVARRRGMQPERFAVRRDTSAARRTGSSEDSSAASPSKDGAA